MGNPDAEVDRRCSHNPTVKQTTVQELQTLLHLIFKAKCKEVFCIAEFNSDRRQAVMTGSEL